MAVSKELWNAKVKECDNWKEECLRECGGQFVPKESIIKIAKERNAMKRELGLLGDALSLSGNTKLSDYLTKIKELQDEIGKLWKKSFDDLIEEFDELNYKEDLVLMEDQNCVEVAAVVMAGVQCACGGGGSGGDQQQHKNNTSHKLW